MYTQKKNRLPSLSRLPWALSPCKRAKARILVLLQVGLDSCSVRTASAPLPP
jgi:hypothetical protein